MFSYVCVALLISLAGGDYNNCLFISCIYPFIAHAGADYWSPQTNRGGSLPFQTLAMNHALLDHGLLDAAADRVRYYFTHYITQGGWINMLGR